MLGEADRARRRKPQHPKAAPEQWMVRILNGDAGQDGDVALIGRGVRCEVRSKGIDWRMPQKTWRPTVAG